jgi:hypothetical protein
VWISDSSVVPNARMGGLATACGISAYELASQTIVSWNPLAEWLGAVDKLRGTGFGAAGADSAASAPAGL